MPRIGFTSTIPVEVIFAAGAVPVDINNLFAAAPDPVQYVQSAKQKGFPDTTCSWICGLYSAVLDNDIDTVVGVTGGDCAETIALIEVLAARKKHIVPFAYPHSRSREDIILSIRKFAAAMGTTLDAACVYKTKLDRIRRRVAYLDMLLYKENKGNSSDVQLAELCCTDFLGDPDIFLDKVEQVIERTEKSAPHDSVLRIGLCGVPPIISDLYQVFERNDARVVFSEVERQFSIPYPESDLVDAYLKYTYPYGIYARLEDISREIEERRIDGIVHYVQSFCYRSIEDIVLREKLDVPVLTVQGGLPEKVSETLEIRIEAFCDMLVRKKKKCNG